MNIMGLRYLPDKIDKIKKNLKYLYSWALWDISVILVPKAEAEGSQVLV